MPHALDGKVVIVTGAAQGIGLATSQALTQRGALVTMADVDGERVAAAATAVGGTATARALDVTDPAAFADAVAATVGRHGRLDVLVNNAGIMPVGPFVQETAQTTRGVLALNVEGVVHGPARRCLHRAAEQLLGRLDVVDHRVLVQAHAVRGRARPRRAADR